MIEQLPTDIIGLMGVLILTVGGYFKYRFDKAQSLKVKEVHEQIRNDHPNKPNMRDDIDAISEMVRKGLDNIRGDIRGVHKDISQLHGSIGGVRRELHEEIERSTRADRNLNDRLNRLHQPPGNSTR